MWKTIGLKRQIDRIKQQVDFMYHKDTTAKVTLEKFDNSTKQLVISINQLVEKYRYTSQQIEKNEVLFKETITNLSHDLRTPLATANGYMQLLEEEELTFEQREFVGIASERIKAVKSLLDQLFELARIEANEMIFKKENVNINHVLRDVLAMFYHDFENKSATPYIKIPENETFVWADKSVLTRIFSNIIYNAIIHGEGDYRIVATVKKETCEIVVSNTTKSIFEEDIPYLFERFFTTDKSRTKKSTGLGLTIARNLTLQMGGTISAYLKEDILYIKMVFPII